MDWSTTCPDWEQRIVAGRSLIPCNPLFPDEAARAIDVFKSLRIADVPGCPTIGESCKPWVIDFAGALFGALDPESGRRLIREYFLLVAKKNTKSTLAGGIMLTALIRNWREEAEYLILAPTLEAAQNAFKPVRGMIARDEELADLFHVQNHVRTVTHRTTGATLKVIAADSQTAAGKKGTGVLVDELWELGKRVSSESMLGEATGGLASRPEGFVIYLSTHSDEPPAGVFRQKLHYARKVRDGEIDDRKFMPVLYEFPPAMLEAKSYLEPENWHVTNPNLGVTVDPEWLGDKLRENQQNGEASLRIFLAKHLNVEIGMALRADRWMGANFWERAQAEDVSLETIFERCEVAVVGIDGGGLDDLLGLYVIGRERAPEGEEGHDVFRRRWFGWGKAWCIRSVLELRKSEASRLLDLEAAGDLSIVDTPGEDIDQLVEIVRRVEDAGILAAKAAVGLDPAGVGSIVDALAMAGIEGDDRVVGVSQGWKMQGAFKTLERKLLDESFLPARQDLMTWSVANARTELKGSAMLITKAASGTAKIDPLMACGDAAALMSMNPSPPQASASVYEDKPLLIL